MRRLYGIAARIVTVYAFFHPAVQLGVGYLEAREFADRSAAGWTSARGDESFERLPGDGTPLLFQEVYAAARPSLSDALFAVVVAVGLLAAGAVLHIASQIAPPDHLEEPARP